MPGYDWNTPLETLEIVHQSLRFYCAIILKTLEIQLRGEFVRLCDLLKLGGLAASGGQGKLLVASGKVTVDGQPESRKTARIRAGQVVDCGDVRLFVQASPPSNAEHSWNPDSPKLKSN